LVQRLKERDNTKRDTRVRAGGKEMER